MRRADLRVGVIDAAFESRESLLALLNVEMLAKVKVASSLTLIAW